MYYAPSFSFLNSHYSVLGMEEDLSEELAARTVKDMGRILARMIADGEYNFVSSLFCSFCVFLLDPLLFCYFLLNYV